MDVRVKFALSVAGLFLFVAALSILIYFAVRDVASPDQSPLPSTGIDATDATVIGFNSVFDNDEEEGTEDEETVPEPEPEVNLILTDPQTPGESDEQTPRSRNPGERIYTVRMHGVWSRHLHNDWYPNGAHLSPMVAWSHRHGDIIYRVGDVASDGMELVAETGSTKIIEQELLDMQNKGFITDYSFGRRIDAPGEDSVRIRVARNTPYVTVVSMIAPSPDWFVAAKNISLYEDGEWVQKKRHTAAVYDAGTDSGRTFTARDRDTNPRQPISLLPEQPTVHIVTFEFTQTP